MLSTFIIALREGLEAALIVGILVAYIVRTDRRHFLKPLWTGVAAALAATFALGAFLSFTSAELSDRGEELFAGITSFIAVGLCYMDGLLDEAHSAHTSQRTFMEKLIPHLWQAQLALL
jgi:FTR1 family protein